MHHIATSYDKIYFLEVLDDVIKDIYIYIWLPIHGFQLSNGTFVSVLLELLSESISDSFRITSFFSFFSGTLGIGEHKEGWL
jgi:hypothetical protein